METITLQVPAEIAQAYRNAEVQQQEKIQALLTVILKKAVQPRPLLEVMQEASKQAIANGMTPEILESILADE